MPKIASVLNHVASLSSFNRRTSPFPTRHLYNFFISKTFCVRKSKTNLPFCAPTHLNYMYIQRVTVKSLISYCKRRNLIEETVGNEFSQILRIKNLSIFKHQSFQSCDWALYRTTSQNSRLIFNNVFGTELNSTTI